MRLACVFSTAVGVPLPQNMNIVRITQEEIMDLGAFSVSLAVKDIDASKLFYEKLGFAVFAGDQSQNWLIMKNGGHAIGLFQGMFEKNILTFNPGWSSDAQPLSEYNSAVQLTRLMAGVELYPLNGGIRHAGQI